jgi:hypothetical protein
MQSACNPHAIRMQSACNQHAIARTFDAREEAQWPKHSKQTEHRKSIILGA